MEGGTRDTSVPAATRQVPGVPNARGGCNEHNVSFAGCHLLSTVVQLTSWCQSLNGMAVEEEGIFAWGGGWEVRLLHPPSTWFARRYHIDWTFLI